jgi:adenylate cyclase
MPVETEHKYLVNQTLWSKVSPIRSVVIQQSYLVADSSRTIRIRIAGEDAYLTIKGETLGASRPEFEYKIPIDDAREMMYTLSLASIRKIRHFVEVDGKTWEVDEFLGRHKGLMLAEIELKDESESYTLPEWVTENVTQHPGYSNAYLALHADDKRL